MEPLELLAAAQRASIAVVARVGADDLGAPTPCEGWDVTKLLDKMVTSGHLFATLCRGEQPGPDLNLLFPEAIAGADPVAALRAACDDCSTAFAESGLEGEMMGPLGVMVPRAAGLKVRSMDATLNTWDLAKAIGADPGISEELAGGCLEFFTGFVPKVRERTDHVRFGDEVAVADDASALDRLVAMSGRDPAWMAG